MSPDSGRSDPLVTVVIHGAKKPEPERLGGLRGRIADALPNGEVIEAFEAEAHFRQGYGGQAAIGEAALVHRAISHARGEVIVALQPSVDWKSEDLRAMAAAARDGLALGVPDSASHDQAGRPAFDFAQAEKGPPSPGFGEVSSEGAVRAEADRRHRSTDEPSDSQDLRAAASPFKVSVNLARRRTLDGLDESEARALRDILGETEEGCAWTWLLALDPLAWAIRRSLYERLGGLDVRLWAVGIVRDLEARARATGASVSEVRITSEIVDFGSYLIEPTLALALAWRNALVSAFKTLPSEVLGVALATISAEAVGASWRAAGVDSPLLQFGGSWGTRSNPLRPRDPMGTLVPLLAIDSFLGQLTALEAERHALRIHTEVRLKPDLTPVLDTHHPGERTATPSASKQVWVPPSPDESARGALSDSRRVGGPGPAPFDIAQGTKAGSPPMVSVIVVNWNGKVHLRECFQSLLASAYPQDRLQLICVDNGSTDGSQAFLAKEFPSVTVVALDENRGFTGGNEAGVAVARGDVLLFLNNDMRVDADAVAKLVEALPDHACAAARVLSWDGRRIDFIQGTLNFEARGFQERFGERVRPETSVAPDTFFPNGGAFAVTRAAYDACGGFDPDFFAYYDDVDLGWRLRLVGVVPRVVPEAVVYHRHGATSSQHPRGHKRFLMERNALWTALKNYDTSSLRRVLAPILLLAVRRITQDIRIPRSSAIARQFAPLLNSGSRVSTIPTTTWELVYRSAPTRRTSPPWRDLGGAPTEGAAGAQADLSPQTTVGATPHGRAQGPPLREPHGPPLREPQGPPLREPQRSPLREQGDHVPAHENRDVTLSMESLAALGAGLEALPRVAIERRKIQSRRSLPDAEVLSRFGRALEYNSSRASYMNIQDTLVTALDVPPLLRGRSRVVIITHEPLRKNISGPGVRALEFGRALGQTLRVTIAAPGEVELTPAECVVAPYRFEDQASLRRIAEQADVLLVRGFTLAQFPFLRDMHVPIAVDLYCPFTLEHLEMNASNDEVDSEAFQREASNILAIQNEQLGDGDFFICASERQRDFWIGTLHGAGRINPQTYAADPTLRHLIDVVPFGLPDESFEHAVARSAKGGRVLKGVRPGIGFNDHVLLWGGSILDWQDPVLLVRAVAELSQTRSDVKLFFMGTKHPNPQVKPARAVADSIETARQLNVLDQYVFFNDWVPYEERAAYLAEADLGLSTHTDHLETRYSFRTRMLDYIWASLPIVCTEGDHFGAMVREQGLGLTVPPGDARALAAAIGRLLDNEEQRRECVRHLGHVASELRWSRVVEPLRQFLTDPKFAPDRAPAVQAMRKRLAQSYRMTKWLKRTALSVGVGEGTIETLKETAVVRAAMAVRNKIALARVKGAKG